MQKTPLYKRCLPALALLLALMLPLVSLAEVSKVVKGGALNMRAEPSLSAQVLRQYPTGTWMTVLEDMGEWSKVRVNGLEGDVYKRQARHWSVRCQRPRPRKRRCSPWGPENDSPNNPPEAGR